MAARKKSKSKSRSVESALKLEIYSRREKLGQLEIGRGSLYWTGAHRQIEKRLNWGKVAQMLDDLAYGSR
jgi:hypothetical protein